MITVRYCPKLLSSEGQEVKKIPFELGKTAVYYVDKAGFYSKDCRIIVNGKRVSEIYVITYGEEISVAENIGDAFSVSTLIAYIIKIIVYLVVAWVVSYGMNLLFARKPNRNTSGNGLDDGSQTYGWDGIRTTQEVGTPIPVVYGEHMVGGNIINQFLTLDGDKHYLNILLALCEGEIQSIDSVRINDNPKENYDGITYAERLGTNSQTVVANFEDLHDVNSVNVNLTKTNPHTYTTASSEVEGFDINLTLPAGLYQGGGDGSISAWAVTYNVKYKLHSEPTTWTDLGDTTISALSRTSLNRIFSKRGLTAGQYDIKVERTSDDSSLSPLFQGDLTWSSLDEIRTDDLAYPNTAIIGIKALATDQLNGSTPNFQTTIKGRKVSVPDVKSPASSGSFGSGNYIKANSDTDIWDFGTGDWTIDFHVNFRYTDYTGTLLGDGNYFYLEKTYGSNSGNLHFYYFNGSAKADYNYTWNPPDGWNHIELVRNSGTIKLFINGVLTSWTTINVEIGSSTMNVASLNVLIGRSAGSGANTFEIAEFRVSHTARHSSTFTVPTEKYSTDSYTKLLMHFEGIDGSTTFIDSSGLNHTFAVTGLAEITTDYYVFGGDDVDWADYYWDDSTEQYKRFSDDMVCSWDYATFRTAWSANPVWCLRDLIINTRFGLGDFIDTTMIDLASFITASQYCENRVANGSGGYEKKHRLDIVLDSSTKALDALIQISQTFRGLLLYSSGTIRLKVDKADLPVQLFGMGNIVKDSFQQSWMSLKDRFSVIEAQYLDKNKLYCQEKIAVLDEVSIASGEPMRKQQLRVFCTSPSYAYREARFYLWRYKYLKRAVSFKAGIDAICCEAGDIINVSHDVPAWGASGRVVSGTSNTIVIDQQYTLQSGKTYQIMVRHSDDTIEEKTITTSPSATNTLTISGTFSVTPSAYDAYAVGEVDIEVKPFRIQEIKIGNDHLAEISAIEYNESIYDDSAPPFDTNYSALNLGVPDVTNLALTERLVKMSDGTIGNAIDVWWTNPDSTNYSVMFSHVRIYLSDDGGDSWTYYGEARSNRFTILDHLVDGTEYTIAVVSVGATGNEKDKATAPQETITLVGKSAPPSDVTSFLCNQSRDRLTFGWTGVADLDLFGYEIRFGDSWESGYVLATQLKNTNYIELNFPIGTLSYWIKAIDTSGNYSTNAKQATITVDNIPFQNIVVEYQEQTAWSGTKVDCSKVGDNIELDAGELTGTYTTDVRDAGYVANFGIKVETIVVDATSSDQEFDDDPDEEWDDSETKRFSGDEVVGAVGLEIRTSDDNVTWSDWIAYQAGDYSCRYFQLRATLTRQNTATVLQLTEMNYYADLPDCDEYGSDAVSVAGDGKSVAFTKMFHQDANVNIEILSGTGTYHRFSVNPDSTGFTVKLYDSSGTAVVGDFSWYAHGI